MLKKFRDFSKINETSEFNNQRMGNDPGSIAGGVDDPSLSLNSYDKHQSKIQQGMSVLNGLAMQASPSINGLKGKLALENQNIDSVKILRIVPKNLIKYDAYITFVIQNIEYWGMVEDITSRDAVLTSEVFNDQGLIQSTEWIIRTKGTIIKAINEWMCPKEGSYTLLIDDIKCNNNATGEYTSIEKNTVVEVIRSHDNTILISVNNERFTLSGKNYIYFNWWFSPVD